jgi:ABC-2 type transport system permease protein
VVDAVQNGQPAAIFEDPFPYMMKQVVGTAEEKPPMGGMFGMGGQPQQKGDIRALWEVLGIQVTGDAGPRGPTPGTIIWQQYKPYPKFQIEGIGHELIFVRNDAPGAKDAFNPSEPVVARFEELLFPYPTGISQATGSKLKFSELVSTSATESGTIEVNDWRMSISDPHMLQEKRGKQTGRKYTLAAWIRDTAADKDAPQPDDKKKADDKKAETGGKAAGDEEPKSNGINVIYVGDCDLLHSEFVQLRNQPNTEINFRFDNVPFVLNVIDAVAGDERFLEIRTRKPRHSTLKTVEARAAAAREKEEDATAAARAEYEELKKKTEKAQKDAEDKLNDIQEKWRKRQEAGEEIDRAEMLAEIQQWLMKVETEKRKADVELERIRNNRDKKLQEVERKRDQDIQQIQNEFKVWATAIPPIPPLLVGFVVWVRRRIREREGISRSRMK